jgi:hypothetical protein
MVASVPESLNTTAVAVEPEQGSVTATLKLTCYAPELRLKVEEPAGPLLATVISFVK